MTRFLLVVLLIIGCLPAWAADRYWVGGTANWTSSNTTNWSTSSGGSGGASVPTTSDNCFFDSSSGSGTVTMFTGLNCLDLTISSGYPGTLGTASTSITIAGNITVASGVSITGNNIGSFNMTGTSKTITMNGVSFPVQLSPGGTITMGGALTLGGTLLMSNGGASFTTGGYALTAGVVNFTAGTTLNLGASAVEVTSTGNVFIAGGTLNAGTSTVKVSNASATGKTVNPGGNTFNNLWFTGSGTGTFAINNDGTFADLKVDTPPHTLQITAGRNITAATITINGTSGNLMTLQSSSAGSAFTFTVSSGTVICNYCSIKDSTATGGAGFYATNSTNVSGNTGWTFGAPPTPGGYGFSLFPFPP